MFSEPLSGSPAGCSRILMPPERRPGAATVVAVLVGLGLAAAVVVQGLSQRKARRELARLEARVVELEERADVPPAAGLLGATSLATRAGSPRAAVPPP